MSAAALEAGLSKSLVTKWKVNKVEVPSPDVLKKLSAYFNIPVSELLGEDQIEAKKEQPTEYDGLSEKRKALMQFAMEVPEDKAEMILQVMKTILKND
jgi:transcriptional regulator with XRE-family HTH domain